jgi:CubicO group peptidase (beta-lactamase class C family)
MQRDHIPGLSLAVVKDGGIKCAGYGEADVDHHIRATPETVYNIASVGKQFIATGVMLLIEDPRFKFGLDDLAVRFLREPPPSWNGITVRHLLTHTSGLRREPATHDPYLEHADAEVIRNSYGSRVEFAPGRNFAYSNLGYYVLAEIITVVTGDHWTKFIENAVFKRAGLNMTRPTNRTDNQAAKGYRWNGRRLTPASKGVALRPSGAYASTVVDLAKWDRVLRTDQVLTIATRNQMWSPVYVRRGYGFGWRLRTSKHHGRLAYHSGAAYSCRDFTRCGGFRSFFRRYLDVDLAVIILSNSDDTRRRNDPGRMRSLMKLSHDIAKGYLPSVEEEGDEGVDD